MIGHFRLPQGIFIDTESNAISIQLNAEIWKLPADKFKALLENAKTNVRYARDLETIESFGYINLLPPDEVIRAASRININPFADEKTKSEILEFIAKVNAKKAKRAMQRVPRKSLRKQVIERDKGFCRYCGKTGERKIHIDHIVPYSLGGKTDISNLVVACVECNSKKHDRTLEQAGMELLEPNK